MGSWALSGGSHGRENLGRRSLSPLRRMVVRVVLPPAMMNKLILAKLAHSADTSSPGLFILSRVRSRRFGQRLEFPIILHVGPLAVLLPPTGRSNTADVSQLLPAPLYSCREQPIEAMRSPPRCTSRPGGDERVSRDRIRTETARTSTGEGAQPSLTAAFGISFVSSFGTHPRNAWLRSTLGHAEAATPAGSVDHKQVSDRGVDVSGRAPV